MSTGSHIVRSHNEQSTGVLVETPQLILNILNEPKQVDVIRPITVATECWHNSIKKCGVKTLRYGSPDTGIVDSCGNHKGNDRLELLNKSGNLIDNGSAVKIGKLEGENMTGNGNSGVNGIGISGNLTKMGCYSERCSVQHLTYGYEKGKGVSCAKHKRGGMVNVIHRMCSKCQNKHPIFGTVGGKPEYCGNCREPNMVNIRDRMCLKCQKKRPTFGLSGGKAEYCGDCKEPNMVNVISKMCSKCQKKRPTFGLPGGKVEYCGDCKEINMVDGRHRMCSKCQKKRPIFGLPGGKAEYCGDCKEPNMTDVQNIKCLHCQKKQSIFGLPGGKAEYCGDCKEPNMTNVQTRKCSRCQKKRPIFGLPGGKAEYCGDCKERNMVNVADRMCSKCDKYAWYGIPGHLPSSCAQHVTLGMISNPRKRCLIDKCFEISLYGYNTHEYCEQHCQGDMNNYIERECQSCHLPEILNTEMKCRNCDQDHFMRRRLVKQDKVRDVLLAREFEFDSNDRQIGDSCDRERPDFIYYRDKHVVIVEVDENQHRGYAIECETIRMINIFYSFAGLKTIFIRYNPDSFKLEGKKQEIGDARRHDVLISWLKYCLDVDLPEDDDNFLQVVYLYYHEFEEGKAQLHKIPVNPHDADRFNDNDNNDEEIWGFNEPHRINII